MTRLRASPRAFAMPAPLSCSTPASTCSRRRRESRRRFWRSRPGCGSWRRAARRFASPARRGFRSRRSLVPAPGTEGRSPAVELFLERARAARPGFEADGEAVALAAEIARRVDGLPLALELAAARVNVLGLTELVSILERRAALLRDTPASDPARAALQGLVDWSYDLLHGDEKTLLHQLAVHRGGASRDSLVAVAATHGLNEATVNYLLSALVDKSIVTVSFSGDTARYDMLDSVREYVLDRLAENGSLGAVRGSHAEYFARLAEEARFGLRGARMAAVAGPPRPGQRQPLGRPRLRAGSAGLRRGGPSRDARLVLHAGRARLGGPALPRARSRRDGGRRAGQVEGRAARHPLLPRSRGARCRRRSRGGRTRARAGVDGRCSARARTGPAGTGKHPRVLGGRRARRGDGASCTGDARGGRGRLGRRGRRADPGGHRGAWR